MKKLLLLLLLVPLFSLAQKENIEEILAEGKLLYRLEKGSWYSTDDMLANYPEKRDSIGGYLSYETDDHKVNSIFYSRFNPNDIILRYHFDSLVTPKPIRVEDHTQRATTIETRLIKLRSSASEVVYNDKESFFSHYENTSFNIIPLIDGKRGKVYILTAPQKGNYVIIGNDYLLTFNKKDEYATKIKLHNSILAFDFASDDSENNVTSAIHSHVVTELITATDICTLLLYKDYLKWETHYVIGEKYVSIFDLNKEIVAKMTTKAWKKISESTNDQKK